MGLPPPDVFLPILIVIFLAIGLHEYAHCALADAAGDPTPRYYGRVTLNLFKHFEPMGTIMMILSSVTGYGIGWGRSAPMDPRKMRNPRWDLFAAVAAGPLSNLLQATIYGQILRLVLRTDPSLLQVTFIAALLIFGVTINLSLMLFNLIPFGPLDGHWLVGQLLPEKPRLYWYRFNRGVGRVGLFAVIMLLQLIRGNGGPNVLQMIVFQPIHSIFHFLVGTNIEDLLR